MVSAGQRTLVVWAVIAVVAFVVLRRIGIAALFGKKNPAAGDTVYGGGAGGGVTAPGVSPTPLTPTQAQVSASGDPVGQTTTLSGAQLIASTVADRAADFSRVTYKSPGEREGYNIPRDAPVQNVSSNGRTVPISLSDYAVKNKLVLPGAMTAPSNPSGPVSW